MLPNVLLIITDQQRFDSLGSYGSHIIPTPHLDRLAEDGAVFENCYVNNPICTPSRASLFTGKPLPGHGVYRLHDLLPEEENLFPCQLREKNYRTALIGKLHVSGRSHEINNRHPHDGFEVYEYALSPHDLTEGYNSYASWLRINHPSVYERLNKEGRRFGHFSEETHFTHWAADRTADFIKKRNILPGSSLVT